MRKLTFHRMKSFVGSVGKVKLYVEDPYEPDLTIAGVPCRLLGKVKNGASAEFEVPDTRCKIFAIADKLSKEYCSDLYQLEAGTEPVTVSGSFTAQLTRGNVFRFSNNTGPEALEHHAKTEKKGHNLFILYVVAFIAVALIVKFLSEDVFTGANKDKVFTHGELSITLTNGFRETEYEGFEVCYDSLNVAVMVLKEGFADYEGLEELSVEEYGELMIEYHELEDTLKLREDGAFLSYTDSAEGVEYFYQAYIFKSDEAFWTVTFATDSTNAQKYSEKIEAWASTVSVG